MSDNGACGHCGSFEHTDVDCQEWYDQMDVEFDDDFFDDVYAGDY